MKKYKAGDYDSLIALCANHNYHASGKVSRGWKLDEKHIFIAIYCKIRRCRHFI
jgi:hypothetical protein